MAITVKELLEYINENLSDGTLTNESKVYVHDGCEAINAEAIFNDAKELTIAVSEDFMGDYEII